MKTFISWIMIQFYNPPPRLTPAGTKSWIVRTCKRITGVKSGLIMLTKPLKIYSLVCYWAEERSSIIY